QPSGERIAVRSRQGHDLIACLQDAARPGDDVLPGVGEGDIVRLPLDELDAEVLLQLLQLRRERRLADEAALRRPPEMPRIGDRDEITEIFQFDVGHLRALRGSPPDIWRLSEL